MHPRKRFNKQNIYHNYTDIKQVKKIRLSTKPDSSKSITKRYQSAKQSCHQSITYHSSDNQTLPKITQKPPRSQVWQKIKDQLTNSFSNRGLQLQKVLDTNRSRDFSQQIYFLQELRQKNQRLKTQLSTIECLMIQVGIKKQKKESKDNTRCSILNKKETNISLFNRKRK